MQLVLEDPYVHEEPRKITKEEREFNAYRALRDGRAQARHEGKRKARQAKVRRLYLRLYVYRSLLTSNVEGGRRGQQEEINGSVVPFLLFLSTVCPCHAPMYSCTLKINPSTAQHLFHAIRHHTSSESPPIASSRAGHVLIRCLAIFCRMVFFPLTHCQIYNFRLL